MKVLKSIFDKLKNLNEIHLIITVNNKGITISWEEEPDVVLFYSEEIKEDNGYISVSLVKSKKLITILRQDSWIKKQNSSPEISLKDESLYILKGNKTYYLYLAKT